MATEPTEEEVNKQRDELTAFRTSSDESNEKSSKSKSSPGSGNKSSDDGFGNFRKSQSDRRLTDTHSLVNIDTKNRVILPHFPQEITVTREMKHEEKSGQVAENYNGVTKIKNTGALTLKFTIELTDIGIGKKKQSVSGALRRLEKWNLPDFQFQGSRDKGETNMHLIGMKLPHSAPKLTTEKQQSNKVSKRKVEALKNALESQGYDSSKIIEAFNNPGGEVSMSRGAGDNIRPVRSREGFEERTESLQQELQRQTLKKRDTSSAQEPENQAFSQAGVNNVSESRGGNYISNSTLLGAISEDVARTIYSSRSDKEIAKSSSRLLANRIASEIAQDVIPGEDTVSLEIGQDFKRKSSFIGVITNLEENRRAFDEDANNRSRRASATITMKEVTDKFIGKKTKKINDSDKQRTSNRGSARYGMDGREASEETIEDREQRINPREARQEAQERFGSSIGG